MNDKCDTSDWDLTPGDLHEAWARKTLLEISKADAFLLLKGNPTTYTEALAYAKGSCFIFHLENLLDFLLGNESEDNFAAAYAYMNLVRFIREKVTMPDGLKEKFKNGAEKIAKNQLCYGADFDIYGDFKKMYADAFGME